MSNSETQQALAFAAMCVDATAKAEGCKRQEMYLRLKKSWADAWTHNKTRCAAYPKQRVCSRSFAAGTSPFGK